MEPEETYFNHNRLVKAHLRLAAEAKKLRESSGARQGKDQVTKPQRKYPKPKEPPAEQLRLF